MDAQRHFTAVVIGSGFGATMTALPLAKKFLERAKGETILMIERGTWWTTPVSTIQDKEVNTREFLVRKGQPVQYWSSLNRFRGFIDIFTRCLRRKNNEDGLYDMTRLGKPGFLGLLGGENDGVSILRANGVGGGSLIYSNITIRPPDFIFAGDRWPLDWSDDERSTYFDYARHAIGYGVLSAFGRHTVNDNSRDKFLFRGQLVLPDPLPYNGLSNIVTRTARLTPNWDKKPDP